MGSDIRDETGGIFRERSGWGWICKLCPIIAWDGRVVKGRHSDSKMKSKESAVKAWDNHQRRSTHQWKLAELRRTQEFVDRVLDLVGVVDR